VELESMMVKIIGSLTILAKVAWAFSLGTSN